jgi:hypothetical protein
VGLHTGGHRIKSYSSWNLFIPCISNMLQIVVVVAAVIIFKALFKYRCYDFHSMHPVVSFKKNINGTAVCQYQ